MSYVETTEDSFIQNAVILGQQLGEAVQGERLNVMRKGAVLYQLKHEQYTNTATGETHYAFQCVDGVIDHDMTWHSFCGLCSRKRRYNF